MNRYQDNSSPEPNVGLNLNDCYKTPNIQQYNPMLNFQMYPTPPSDNDDSSLTEHSNMIDKTKLTPNLPSNYYNVSNDFTESHDGYQIYNQNNTSIDEYVTSKQTTPESVVQQSLSQNQSKFKRRSRTTYSKSQLDALESTFEQTHYPDIRTVDELSLKLKLSTERISIWFQNRRARFKKARKLEHQENQAKNNTPNINVQYSGTSFYPTPNCYPSLVQPINNSYTPLYPNNDKLKNYAKIVEPSTPQVSSNVIDSYSAINRNLLNNFSPSQPITNLTPNTPPMMNTHFYTNIPSFSSNNSNLFSTPSFYSQR